MINPVFLQTRSKMKFFIFTIVFMSTVSGQITMVTPGFISDLTKPTTAFTTPTVPTTTQQTPPTTPQTTTMPTPLPTTPKPSPSSKIYYVFDANGICLLFSANIKINFGNIYQENSTQSFEVDKVDTFDGTCGEAEEMLTLHFWKDWTLELKATKVDNSSYDVELIQLKYNTNTAPKSLPFSHTGAAMVKNLTDYSNGLGQEYVCRSGLRFNDTLSAWNYTLSVWLDDFKLEAFRDKLNTTEFSANGLKSCEADVFYNNLIPIIVGGVLVLLILVVLVAYLISRRSRRSGYESV